MPPEDLLEKMSRDWDRRAEEDFRYFIANGKTNWSDEEFIKSGEQTVSAYALTDMSNICQGLDPKNMRVLDFGCGAGRVTRALAQVFGEVHGVDVSGKMLTLARGVAADLPNVTFHRTNGKDLSVLGDLMFDFAFSFAVFHHIPNKVLIESCIRDVGRHLYPGRLFKFSVQGHLPLKTTGTDTWLGPPMSDFEMQAIAERCSFEARHAVGSGEEDFWLWFFKKAETPGAA